MRKNKYIWLALVFVTSVSMAAQTPPAKKKKLTLQDLLKASSNSSKRSANVAGVRGLDETGGVIDTKARDFGAVERMEKVAVHPDELAKFLAEGKLK